MDRSSRVELKKKYIDDQVGWNAKLNIYIYIYCFRRDLLGIYDELNYMGMKANCFCSCCSQKIISRLSKLSCLAGVITV